MSPMLQDKSPDEIAFQCRTSFPVSFVFIHFRKILPWFVGPTQDQRTSIPISDPIPRPPS